MTHASLRSAQPITSSIFLSFMAVTMASLLVAPALAQDLTAASAEPSVTFDDTDNGDDADWQFVVTEDSPSPLKQTFSLLNRVGTNDFPMISVVGEEGAQGYQSNSFTIDEFGDIRLAEKMYVGRETFAGVSIGNDDPPSDVAGVQVWGYEGYATLRLANAPGDYLNIQYDQLFDPNPVLTMGFNSVVPFRMYKGAPDGSFTMLQSGNIGFGTKTPEQAVDVERIAAPARFQLTAYTAEATEAPQYIQRRARGNKNLPGALQSGDNLGLFSFRGYNGSAMTGSRVAITAQAAGNWSTNSNPTRLTFGTTPVGSTVVQTVLEITPQGTVKINGSNLNVPDYVFEDDYALLPLDELQTFIDANGHLPGIAAADEVNANGLDVAGTQMGLLEKVEELTLYTLQQHEQLKQLDELRAENEDLRLQLAELRSEQAEVKALMTRLLAEDEAKPVMTAGR